MYRFGHKSLPHARGGVSAVQRRHQREGKSSPRSWGCFRPPALSHAGGSVFPTLVGVFPMSTAQLVTGRCLPHARGGVSFPDAGRGADGTSSPRSWGCFCRWYQKRGRRRVFPTLVGVFPALSCQRWIRRSLPHARGGVSRRVKEDYYQRESSPRSWGCFRRGSHRSAPRPVFPTLVGVFLTRTTTRCWTTGLPHARGGVSSHGTMRLSPMESSPRSWGCFQLWFHFECTNQVVPTLVGVFLIISICLALPCRLPHARGGVSLAESAASPSGSLPHARGGVSLASISVLGSIQSSPRSWGCFRDCDIRRPLARVFPTLVGVFPAYRGPLLICASLPHARGGVSFLFHGRLLLIASSPRSWGCFHSVIKEESPSLVFPTLVGVFPPRCADARRNGRLPHARGGVSPSRPPWKALKTSSPRSWGCFCIRCAGGQHYGVFPTLVGVFLSISRPGSMVAGLPHARGGVSPRGAGGPAGRESSPRSWGCFRHLYAEKDPGRVFPTLVGVFLCHEQLASYVPRLPHARGGVSSRTSARSRTASSSPRSWGCFQVEAGLRNSLWVFPTLVGVFPIRQRWSSRSSGLPHARGGVSPSASSARRLRRSSPRSWGCFFLRGPFFLGKWVFPTLVGVFPHGPPCGRKGGCLPHARGGVSATNAAT